MAETGPPLPLPKSQPSFVRRQSTIIKLLGVGALVLVLLIPLMVITGVLRDRLSRRNEAVAKSIGTNSDSISYSFWVTADGFVERGIIAPNPFAGLVVNR
jgi:Inner membrane protein CreD